MNIKNLSDKILLYFDQGIYFEDTPEGQVDYMMTTPRLILHKSNDDISKEDLSSLIGELSQVFNLDVNPDLGLKEVEKELDRSYDINI